MSEDPCFHVVSTSLTHRRLLPPVVRSCDLEVEEAPIFTVARTLPLTTIMHDERPSEAPGLWPLSLECGEAPPLRPSDHGNSENTVNTSTSAQGAQQHLTLRRVRSVSLGKPLYGDRRRALGL